MNAEALIGTVLGTCTLEQLVGQGGMGAVFLAQQSRQKRQVAVKVLLPMKPLSPNQLAAFLELFRRFCGRAEAGSRRSFPVLPSVLWSLRNLEKTPVHHGFGRAGGRRLLVFSRH